MGTTSISEALEILATHIKAAGPCDHAVNICVCGDKRALEEARAELARIREAAKTLDRLAVGDFTYNIRDRAAGDESFSGNTWNHPDVKAWSDAAGVMRDIAKEGT